MQFARLSILAMCLAGCAVDPNATNSTVERNAAAEADLRRGIVCKRQSGGDFELDRTECTTPDEREEQREAAAPEFERR